jgi:hypothetical protein
MNKQGTKSSDRDRFFEGNQCSSVGLGTQGSGDGPSLTHDAQSTAVPDGWSPRTLPLQPAIGAAFSFANIRGSNVHHFFASCTFRNACKSGISCTSTPLISKGVNITPGVLLRRQVPLDLTGRPWLRRYFRPCGPIAQSSPKGDTVA